MQVIIFYKCCVEGKEESLATYLKIVRKKKREE